MILVSGCLCGINCKYNGKNNLNEDIYELFKKGELIPVCPEQLGGKETPRPPHEIINGTGADVLDCKACVVSNSGANSTKEYIKGAHETLSIAKALKVKYAILKSKSPSCGFGFIYNGKFNGEKVKGNGVTSELLFRNGIIILNEENFMKNNEIIKLLGKAGNHK